MTTDPRDIMVEEETLTVETSAVDVDGDEFLWGEATYGLDGF